MNKGSAIELGGKPKTKFFKMPHTFVIILCMVLFAAVLTYLLPAGEFDRAEDKSSGNTVVVEGSYHAVEQNPVSLVDLPLAIVQGLVSAADTVFFIFIVGGVFQIINSTGTIEAVAARVGKTFMNRGLVIIPIFLSLFSVGGFTIGMSAEVMAFVPIGIAIARALGYDAVTGTAMVMLGAAVGFTAGLLNPFNVGIAQSIAELPMFSGMWLRAIILVVLLVVTSLYIIRYAKKVKKNPASSIVYQLEKEEAHQNLDISSLPTMKAAHYLTIVTVIAGFGFLIWGVSEKGWWMQELAAFFLALGVIVGFLSKYGPSKIASEFVAGASAITFGAFIVGFAKGIVIVLEQGHVIDSVVNGLASMVDQMPGVIQVLGMYFFQTIMNVFITSGTGLAATTMPILVPLSDLIDVTRQTTVLSYQLGDGLSNCILPTSAMLMGSLAVSRIKYQEWVKFFWPLLLWWVVIGAFFVIVADMIQY
ncbi:YfcC family protein [Bacillus sp. T33-2]|uniref:YfcC family protein n=1 Tax=Bacillus sp. T33-2 TaxID=2054168 RepID=UPI000C766950|nr:YfcC family protein [Bacillus sp. T33-2]PLR95959.1 C4-dicarboxylate ABC transporter permease [Bacillus sp. T33-2]